MSNGTIKMRVAIGLIFTVVCAAVIFPFLLVVSISFSSESDIFAHGYNLFPRNIDLGAYEYVFKNPGSVLNAYKVTALFSVIGTALSVFFISLLAYPLSRKYFNGRRQISFFLYFTMLFNGGLVPTYILITQYLRLGNSLWVYILPSLISPWFVFMTRSFFQSISSEICESAIVDGADEFLVLFKMVLPLSKPVLATIALLTFLGKWNDWYTSMLYVDDESLISLQYLLQRILRNIALIQEHSGTFGGAESELAELPAETARMAMAVVVAGPALLVFPFFQKYFTKGLTVGSVKG